MKYITLFMLLMGLFFCLDIGLDRTKRVEVGVISYKGYTSAGAGGRIINVIQPVEQRSYFFPVNNEQWDTLHYDDRVPIIRKVGALTGYEYKVELKLD